MAHLGVEIDTESKVSASKVKMAVAEKLSGLPPLAVRAMKRVLNQGAASDITTALRLETEATIASFLDPETTERLKNF